MEILDPDLWNDDGTPKRPSKVYMDGLNEAQHLEALDPETRAKRDAELAEAMRLYRITAAKERAPEVGDIVHFWGGEKCRAALVMETEGHSATLRVHIPNASFQDWTVDHDEEEWKFDQGDPMFFWHWPCGEGR